MANDLVESETAASFKESRFRPMVEYLHKVFTLDSQKRVGIIMTESPSLNLIHEMIACEASLSKETITGGFLNSVEFKSVMEATGIVYGREIYFDSIVQYGFTEIRKQAKIMKERYDIEVCIVEDIRVTPIDPIEPNVIDSRMKLPNGLEMLARELGIPVAASNIDEGVIEYFPE